jgi:hypothetical protein
MNDQYTLITPFILYTEQAAANQSTARSLKQACS